MVRIRRAAAAALIVILPLGGSLFAGNSGQVRASRAAVTPVSGGTVIDGLYEEPTALLPNTGVTAFSIGVQETLFSPLFYTDGAGKLHAGLAATVPTLANGGISKDGLTYTFTLRPALEWSDGQPLDARDVDFSWRLWTSPDVIVNSRVGFDDIKSADVSADHLKITFHLKQVYVPFLSIWVDQVMPVPQHALKDLTGKQINTSKFLFQPTVGSGPFVIASRHAGADIVEKRNPHFYMAGRPYLDQLIFRIIPEQTSITNALRAHEIDAAWFLDISQVNVLRSISGYTFLAAPAPNYEQAVVNFENPILRDVRVRQALEYGLDRPAMVKDVWHGAAQLIASDQVSASFSYDPSVQAVSLRSGEGQEPARRRPAGSSDRMATVTRTGRPSACAGPRPRTTNGAPRTRRLPSRATSRSVSSSFWSITRAPRCSAASFPTPSSTWASGRTAWSTILTTRSRPSSAATSSGPRATTSATTPTPPTTS